MYVFFARSSRPDAVVWPGRRLVACLDALGWPAAWCTLMTSVQHAGVLSVVAPALAALLAVMRLQCALLRNQRFRFSTWVWGRRFALVWALGCLLKLATMWA